LVALGVGAVIVVVAGALVVSIRRLTAPSRKGATR
jgi:hypothetical protein